MFERPLVFSNIISTHRLTDHKDTVKRESNMYGKGMRREESTATVPQSAKQLCVCTDDARVTEVTPDPQLESTARCIDRACITEEFVCEIKMKRSH